MSSALPLKTPTKSEGIKSRDITPTNTTSSDKAGLNGRPKLNVAPKEISSPHELTAFVETLLEQLDNQFDDMSSQILDKMSQMSSRVDALEASIQDIINGDISGAPPSPGLPPAILKRSESAS
ncbi:hypothetical protein CYLTODRAFT_401049 [Cylindrobasidium torrendii FP15055 ss-10]|uniref:Heat shock factor binding protein 1-domain-containing protein n=1 Tax=Cylindrobasidium torrendii FP15055 ss-10 TaxID=1314674 RepID=A0A0D7B346_9AGAR|nr:hypothetical protein CYLTODRAFT_401049 [Cylindrobasidium torrendii FP15055 ss-10]